ncbi:allophanate hydrolase [Paenibacillus sp. CGMCC 1.16610]|uniref:Allophanate hydrolase n=1 Tax=Paenibacillus anseongense TaxID=2682845 RepID=A0ABW9UL69_9BACL|nr:MULTISPECIES: allophanate hydrolase [Paenibacillus]MBA2940171.1 allophanate hydrolase [Paenibacillus sp. CGMCC 1.16610]MVQ38625.1 allophanate hydrolase [Paenibacillus anseongense]
MTKIRENGVDTELPLELTISWLQDKYAKEELTPKEVMAAIVQRAVDDAGMNLWITPPSMALIQPFLDGLAELNPADAPLWGIPFAIKDNIDLAGVPTTAGCEEYAYTPSEHAGVVERLIAAGAIPVGKTNLDQFATGLVGARSPYGDAHNALRPELISGGSSSGSAVAVARGQAAFSLGTDTAGSGRVPAALNRLVGYKPSLGAWPTKGVVPACASLDCVTVFAHSLDDALAVDGVARGLHADDPWSRSVSRGASQPPQTLLLPDGPLGFYGPYAAEYEAAWGRAVEQLQELNLPIAYVDVTMFAQAAAILYEGPWVAERWAALGSFIEANPGVAYPVTEKILRSGSAAEYDAASVFEAMHKLQRFKLEARKLLHGAVLVMPTCGGTWTREQVLADPIQTNREMGRYTNHCNLLDWCAVAVPAGDAAPLTPFGITLFGIAEEESLICGAAELILAGASAASEAASASEGASVCADAGVSAAAAQATTLVAVCGLHMRGYPLEKQMRGCGARFIREDETAAKYSLVKLPTTPAKPGLVKQEQGGAAIALEVWEMPLEAFGGFVAAIPAPLGIGKVELRDGTEVPGFVCEAYAAAGAEDVTALGGWRQVVPLQG